MLFVRGPEITLAPGQRVGRGKRKRHVTSEGVRNNMVLSPKGSEVTSAWAPAISTNPDKRVCYCSWGSEITSASRPKGRLPRESDPENERAGAVEEVGGSIDPSPLETRIRI